ncbi:MAG: nucleotidyltransferase [Acholeplasmatales bacterium]|nr:MAG: nucleotidyltransferase [Acholeplasmatales bacterium]
MAVLGIVVEYNPFHFGHLYHLEEARKQSQADVVIAVMSSHVVQRGEFSVTDKFTRTRWALEAGVDLVIELPGVHVLQNADLFAQASVRLLAALGVDTLCFGSETGDLHALTVMLEVMETDVYHARLRAHLDTGKSYPTSSHLALKSLLKDYDASAPNNILGIQYLRAIRSLDSHIQPFALKRVSTGYYDDLLENTAIQSATAIRAAMRRGEDIAQYVPAYVYKDLKGLRGVNLEDFFPFIHYRLATAEPEHLRALHGFEEGLEHRFLQAEGYDSVASLLEQLLTSRYTHARLKRALMHVLIGTDKSLRADAPPRYIRVLGMNSRGQDHLSKIKKDLTLPLITKLGRDREPLLDIELRITRLYDLVHQAQLFSKEFEPVLIV